MHIPVNTLLRIDDFRLNPAQSKALLAGLQKASPNAIKKARTVLVDPAEIVRNARMMDTQTLRLVYDRYGESGLFNIFVVAGGHRSHVFERLLAGIVTKLVFIGSDKKQEKVLVPDNDRLPQGAVVDKYNTNVLMPWLSRELFMPRVGPGFLVFGLGGSRILVSHPFHDTAGEVYSIAKYAAAIDGHLALKEGINGATCYFDYLPGLRYPLAGEDAWLAWFSLVATHSDAVIFIERAETGLTDSQRREAQAVIDRVPKKIITMTADQLGHSQSESLPQIEHKIYYIADGEMSESSDRMDELESAPTREYLRQYTNRTTFRTDRLHVIPRSRKKVKEYPLNHPMYGHAPLIADTSAHFGPPQLPPELEFLAPLFRDLL